MKRRVSALVAQAAVEAERATAGGLPFGAAGNLCTGPDAKLRQGCAAMLEMFHRFITDNRYSNYEAVVLRLEERAEEMAPLAATTQAGVRAKAAIVRALNEPGMACYAGRILAASLARDVLGEPPPG